MQIEIKIDEKCKEPKIIVRQNKKPIELGDAYRVLSDGSVSKIRIVKSSEGSEE